MTVLLVVFLGLWCLSGTALVVCLLAYKWNVDRRFRCVLIAYVIHLSCAVIVALIGNYLQGV